LRKVYLLVTNTTLNWLWTALLVRITTSILQHGYKHVLTDVSTFAKYVVLLSLLDFIHILSPSFSAVLTQSSINQEDTSVSHYACQSG
jgi:hypothetical protein